VYDDVLAMAWFFLELIVKSMGLEQSRLFYHNLPLGRITLKFSNCSFFLKKIPTCIFSSRTIDCFPPCSR
jgi:hypothetical protein